MMAQACMDECSNSSVNIIEKEGTGMTNLASSVFLDSVPVFENFTNTAMSELSTDSATSCMNSSLHITSLPECDCSASYYCETTSSLKSAVAEISTEDPSNDADTSTCLENVPSNGIYSACHGKKGLDSNVDEIKFDCHNNLEIHVTTLQNTSTCIDEMSKSVSFDDNDEQSLTSVKSELDRSEAFNHEVQLESIGFVEFSYSNTSMVRTNLDTEQYSGFKAVSSSISQSTDLKESIDSLETECDVGLYGGDREFANDDESSQNASVNDVPVYLIEHAVEVNVIADIARKALSKDTPSCLIEALSDKDNASFESAEQVAIKNEEPNNITIVDNDKKCSPTFAGPTEGPAIAGIVECDVSAFNISYLEESANQTTCTTNNTSDQETYHSVSSDCSQSTKDEQMNDRLLLTDCTGLTNDKQISYQDIENKSADSMCSSVFCSDVIVGRAEAATDLGVSQMEFGSYDSESQNGTDSFSEDSVHTADSGSRTHCAADLPLARSVSESITGISPDAGARSRSSAVTPIPLCSNVLLAIIDLGRISPAWVPDSEAPKCMECEVVFSFRKRRHHCRTCGKVFCSGCCHWKVPLEHLEYKEGRVCDKCYQDLARAELYRRMHPSMDTSVPRSNLSSPSSLARQSADGAASLSVSTPTSALRKKGSVRGHGELKQVMFSDGIRPGGDLTELDGVSGPPQFPQLTARKIKRVDCSGPGANSTSKSTTFDLTDSSGCLVPMTGLPPVVIKSTTTTKASLQENLSSLVIMEQLNNPDNDEPVTFAVNPNLVVMVKIINLDCCVNRVCWCFTTRGLCTVGQDEVVLLLQQSTDEETIPIDVFHYINRLYDDASKGNVVHNLSFSLLPPGSFGDSARLGFLYIRPTFQCLQRIPFPDPPYVFAVLLQKWEIPWAKAFPLRLMLRLGAEFKYYPCPLISVRDRRPVYGEIAHTIMKLLIDFNNYQYTLPQIPGLVVLMEEKKTFVKLPRRSYEVVTKVLSSSDESVMAFGASFSHEADSHLVCVQDEDDDKYHTRTINIQDRPRKVTGASFIVFNGALKTSSGLLAKSSVVEDGLMVQITSETMSALKQALRGMKDYTIACGPAGLEQPYEVVIVQWTSGGPVSINAGVRSPIDSMSLDDVENVRVHGTTDYKSQSHTMRWTELFLIRNEVKERSHGDPGDLTRLAEALAQACCLALTPRLEQLGFTMMTKIGLRVTIDNEQVGYEIGSCGSRLPDSCMNELDEKLIPVIHSAASPSRPLTVLELIFHVLCPTNIGLPEPAAEATAVSSS